MFWRKKRVLTPEEKNLWDNSVQVMLGRILEFEYNKRGLHNGRRVHESFRLSGQLEIFVIDRNLVEVVLYDNKYVSGVYCPLWLTPEVREDLKALREAKEAHEHEKSQKLLQEMVDMSEKMRGFRPL